MSRNCNICNWTTRFEPALKGHKKRMHVNNQNAKLTANGFTCDKCEFKTTSKATLMVHTRMNHKEKTKKRMKVTHQCQIDKCESSFDNEEKRTEHMKTQHTEFNSGNPVNLETESPSSSPPRKKLEKHVDEASEMLDLDNMEINIEKELSVNFLLEQRTKELETQKQNESKRIKELEVLVSILLEERKKR